MLTCPHTGRRPQRVEKRAADAKGVKSGAADFSERRIFHRPPSLPRSAEGLRHPLDGVFAVRDVHDWHTRDLSYSPLEISIASSDNVAARLKTTK
jgi:hypothetical protein